MAAAFPRPRLLPALAASGLGVGVLLAVLAPRIRPPSEAPPPPAPIRTVTALGRLAPIGEVRTVAAPSAANGASTLRALLVEEGDPVRQGQVVAVLDREPRLRAAAAAAAVQVEQANTRLQIAIVDHRTGEGAQRARVESLRARRRNAAAEYERYRVLFATGAVSAEDLDARRLSLETADAALRDGLEQLARQRATITASESGTSVDVEAARQALAQALAVLAQARAEHAESLVRAPVSGRVLSVLSRAGEAPGSAGIVRIGATDRMQVVAEVYESDLPRVRLGQPVRVTSPALPRPLEARVGRIGAIVLRQAVINTDPSANTDSRVVEVHAPLTAESNRRAGGLSNLQVRAVIGP
jgi:HlyD family secretion protein